MDARNPGNPQNILLIAGDGEIADLSREKLRALADNDAKLLAYAENLWLAPIPTEDVPLLTDDYAPVESMLAKFQR